MLGCAGEAPSPPADAGNGFENLMSGRNCEVGVPGSALVNVNAVLTSPELPPAQGGAKV